MREIKFRGWTDNFGWFQDNGFLDYQERVLAMKRIGGDAVTIEQFTGLKDKNGREIYEGDVVKVVALDNDHHQRGATSNVMVAYFMSSFCLCFNGLESGVPVFPFNVNHTLEVIGNIHENPELLK